MDVFPIPDVAPGIFFEYLRTDDPISPDFIEHVVDGFPFLLAPLAQVKGVSGSMPQHHQLPPAKEPDGGHGVINAVGSLVDRLSSHAGDVGVWLHENANDAASHITNLARVVGESARSVGHGLDRKRDQLRSQMSSIPEHGIKFLSNRVPMLLEGVSDVLRRRRRRRKSRKMRLAPRGKVFRSTGAKWFGESNDVMLPDGNGSMVHPTERLTRSIFLCLVHLYLLLLLIVSLPGSHYTKLVVRREKKLVSSDTDSEISSESSDDGRELSPTQDVDQSGKLPPEGNMTKSLSYYL